jgi:hypothetical protein
MSGRSCAVDAGGVTQKWFQRLVIAFMSYDVAEHRCRIRGHPQRPTAREDGPSFYNRMRRHGMTSSRVMPS